MATVVLNGVLGRSDLTLSTKASILGLETSNFGLETSNFGLT